LQIYIRLALRHTANFARQTALARSQIKIQTYLSKLMQQEEYLMILMGLKNLEIAHL
jgi:hypothetical protein